MRRKWIKRVEGGRGLKCYRLAVCAITQKQLLAGVVAISVVEGEHYIQGVARNTETPPKSNCTYGTGWSREKKEKSRVRQFVHKIFFVFGQTYPNW